MNFPALASVTVTIGGIDFTSYVKPKTLKITSILSNQVDTLNLTLEPPAPRPDDWQEIIVLDGATRIFGGYVLSVRDVEGADLGLDYEVSASDFSVRLQTLRVKAEYLNKTDKQILSDVFANYLPNEGFDASLNVIDLKLHPRIRFNRISITDVINNLADLSKADWYMDYSKSLYYHLQGDGLSAPYSISDTPDFVSSYPCKSIEENRDGSGVVNRVEVVGGLYLSDPVTFYLPGTGQDNRIMVPFKLHAPDGSSSIQVWRNDGSQATPTWTALTVKIGYINTLSGANEVLFYFNEKVIEQTANFPALPNAVKITACQEVPLRIRATDAVSFGHYGMYFDDVIVDESIVTKEAAKMVARSALAKSASASRAITLEVEQPGLRPGTLLTIQNDLHGINESFVIQRVTTTIGINGRASFSVDVGVYNPDLIDLMIRLAKNNQKQATWRDDEVLDVIQDSAESIYLINENISVSSHSGTYMWGSSNWNFAKWG